MEEQEEKVGGRRGGESDRGRHLASNSGLHMFTHKHAHLYTCMHTCKSQQTKLSTQLASICFLGSLCTEVWKQK